MRRVDDDQPGARAQVLLHHVPVDGEIRQLQREVNGAPARQGNRGLVGVIGRVEDDDLVSLCDAGLYGIEQGLCRPGGHGNFQIHVGGEAVMVQHLECDLFTQLRNAGHRRVLVAAIIQIMAHQFTQTLRAIKVRETLGKVDGTVLLCHSRHHRKNSGAGVRELAAQGEASSGGFSGAGFMAP